jgi:hypothetical protein
MLFSDKFIVLKRPGPNLKKLNYKSLIKLVKITSLIIPKQFSIIPSN